jgi:hypothetical protein
MDMPIILQVMLVPAYVAQKLNQLNRHRKKLIHELFFITSNNQFFTATSALPFHRLYGVFQIHVCAKDNIRISDYHIKQSGTDTYLQNAGYVWLILLIPLSFATWMGMNNITEDHVSPNIAQVCLLLKILY